MSARKARKQRAQVISQFWVKPTPHELDVVDKGDHLKITSCSSEVAAWWMGTLRAAYPQDHYSDRGDNIKMHPEAGVTLKLNRGDGTLRIKGKKHLDWFKHNFEHILESGSKEFAAVAELGRVIDNCLRINDGYSVPDLLEHLPRSGAIKHGPTYIYRLWRGLLDQWISRGGDIYVISPLLDSRRVADILLILVKHRLAHSRLHVFSMPKCDGETKFPRVFKDAKEMVRKIKGPNKKRLIAEERMKLAVQRLEAKFGRFHCKIIAACVGNEAEVMITSASFHKWHFEFESGDVVCHHRLSTEDLITHYLAPLGLEHQLLMQEGGSPAGTSTATTPATSPIAPPEEASVLAAGEGAANLNGPTPGEAISPSESHGGLSNIRPLSHYSTSSRS